MKRPRPKQGRPGRASRRARRGADRRQEVRLFLLRLRPWRVQLAALAAVVVLGVVGVLVWRAIDMRRRYPHLSAYALADSLAATTARHDYDASLTWARALAAADPRNSIVIRKLAVALHNQATMVDSSRGRARPPYRTSLDRMRREHLALACLDSALTLASGNGDNWRRAEGWKGRLYEYLGLPLEALEAYQAVGSVAPGDSEVVERAQAVEVLLLNPRAGEAHEERGRKPQSP